MLKEYHYDHLVRWPRGERAAVFLTFDFQGGEDVKPDKNGILNYESWSQGEYGPHHAIYRLLRILKEENIKATFLTCGAIAERFPEAVEAIIAHGHVVEGHGYNHEIARYLPRDQESEVMTKAIAMIDKRTGRRPYGWRSCTQSTNTIELLIEHGFVFNTNCFHEELPFLWEKDGKLLVELPRQPFGDGTLVRPSPRRIRQSVSRPRDVEGLFRRALFGEQRGASEIHPVHDASLHHRAPRPHTGAARHHPAHEEGRESRGSRPASSWPSGASTTCSRRNAASSAPPRDETTNRARTMARHRARPRRGRAVAWSGLTRTDGDRRWATRE